MKERVCSPLPLLAPERSLTFRAPSHLRVTVASAPRPAGGGELTASGSIQGSNAKVHAFWSLSGVLPREPSKIDSQISINLLFFCFFKTVGNDPFPKERRTDELIA